MLVDTMVAPHLNIGGFASSRLWLHNSFKNGECRLFIIIISNKFDLDKKLRMLSFFKVFKKKKVMM